MVCGPISKGREMLKEVAVCYFRNQEKEMESVKISRRITERKYERKERSVDVFSNE